MSSSWASVATRLTAVPGCLTSLPVREIRTVRVTVKEVVVKGLNGTVKEVVVVKDEGQRIGLEGTE